MKIKFRSILLAVFLISAANCFAQHKTENNSLKQSIALIDSAFQHNNPDDFNRIMPLQSIQEFYASMLKEKLKKIAGKSKIILKDKDSAYVLLSGLILCGNSGDETYLSGSYTGIYKFERTAGSWKLTSRIDIDRANQIKKQNLQIDITPGKGVKIKDTLTLDINDFFGFATKLNHHAKIESLVLNGSKTDFTFSSGLLWVNAKVQKNQQLIVQYTISVEKDEQDKNSSYFADAFGHMRNQYFWHPFFSFSSVNDRADFTLHCTLPKSYYLATSLPQKDSVAGDLRIIEARSEHPTFGLSIYYDKDWEVTTLKKDQINLVIYATKDFLPGQKVLYAEFSKSYDTLQKHFGKPLSNYLGIVQDRTGGNGWKNRSNNMIVAGTKGSYLVTDKPNPRAIFGHEVAQGWTNPTGPATNFLTEGWATYAESVLLLPVYGDSIVGKFFNSQKQNYISRKFDGKSSLWDDNDNSGISYSKGSWLFYMLEHQLGKKNFSAAMANFIRSGDQSIQSFINQMSSAAGVNMEPALLLWLKSKQIPALNIQQAATQLTIRQEGDIFIFPLEIKIKLKDGTAISKVVNMNSKEQLVTIQEGEINSYTIDPDHILLFTIK